MIRGHTNYPPWSSSSSKPKDRSRLINTEPLAGGAFGAPVHGEVAVGENGIKTTQEPIGEGE